MFTFNKSIKSQVRKAIDSYIDGVEKNYKDFCKNVDMKAQDEKNTEAYRLVQSILNKVI